MVRQDGQTRRCAYCDREGPLTKEHLIPASLIRFFSGESFSGESLLAGSERAPNYFIPTELQVRDVCQHCNNVTLSALDTYALNLTRTACREIVHADEAIEFQYDFHLLARWLLKMSYNAARSRDRDSDDTLVLSQYREYALDESRKPSRLAVFLQLIIPRVLERHEEQLLGKETLDSLPTNQDGKYYLPPNPIGVSRTLDGPPFESVLRRIVSIQSYYFVLMLPRDAKNPPENWEQLCVQTLNQCTSSVQLLPASTSVGVQASPITYDVAYDATIAFNEEKMRRWQNDYNSPS